MKKLWISLLALILLLGQAPAWAMVCSQRCMPQASLACLRACAKSQALLTRNGALPSVGQRCGQVQVRLAQPSLAATTAPSLALPVLNYAVPLTVALPQAAVFAILSQAHGPPCAALAQAVLSVPVAQAPPASILSV